MGIEIGGIIEEMHQDEEGRRVIDKVKIEHLSLVPEGGVVDAPKFSGSDEGAKNTDIEIWRKVPDDYYSPSIHVTEQGDIGIKVGGHVLVAPVERWFAAGKAAFCVEEEEDRRIKELEKRLDIHYPSSLEYDEDGNLRIYCGDGMWGDECYGCRYGSCNTCPPLVDPDSLYMEFNAWDELSDEAFEEFEKLVEESAPPITFLDKIRHWTLDDWKDWLMGR